ncbi:MAG: nucleotidyltransferase domain-containing protein [Phycisphaeraceae bacterium]|nr:nucleotidyltransferase domain-containing protein [Phycisphaeraceae bacterium]
MVPLDESLIERIVALCERHGVARLELVGSAADGQFEAGRSDYDFLVDFGNTPRGGLADPYFGLLADLEDLLGAPVDLIEGAGVRNPVVRRSLESKRIQIYAAA